MPYKSQDKRRYIRLSSVFPVEFSLIYSDGKLSPSKYQGFTHDVSKGGLCIRVRNLAPEDTEALEKKQAKLHTCIHISPPCLQNPFTLTVMCSGWNGRKRVHTA